jgi:hypothetical protein
MAAVLVGWSVTAYGGTIESITGSNPFGFTGTFLAEGWNETTGYTGVNIAVSLADQTPGGPLSGVEGTVYLMDQYGPGTTSANELAAPVSVSGLSSSFESEQLFSGLTLGPGNIYLVFIPTSVVLSTFNGYLSSMTPEGSGTPMDIFGSGVADLGGTQTASVFVPAAFAPASNVGGLFTPSNYFITVTGDASATSAPEPAAFWPTLAGIGALAHWRRRYQAQICITSSPLRASSSLSSKPARTPRRSPR